MNMPTPRKPKCKRITNLSENWKSKKFRFSSPKLPTPNANINTENEEFTNNKEHISAHQNKSCMAKPQSHNQKSLV